MSITGIEIGIPDPFLKRYVRATSNTRLVFGVWLRIRHIFAVVPPISKDNTLSSP